MALTAVEDAGSGVRVDAQVGRRAKGGQAPGVSAHAGGGALQQAHHLLRLGEGGKEVSEGGRCWCRCEMSGDQPLSKQQ